MIVGALPDSVFPSETIDVPSGAALIVACDGCYEIRNASGVVGGFKEFEEFMCRRGLSDSALADLLDSVHGNLGTEPLEDDFSIVRVRF